MITLERRDTIAEIGLDNGPLNLVDKTLLHDLDRALGECAGR